MEGVEGLKEGREAVGEPEKTSRISEKGDSVGGVEGRNDKAEVHGESRSQGDVFLDDTDDDRCQRALYWESGIHLPDLSDGFA